MKGWFDIFNGIRTPEAGSCASFEELLSEVIKHKKDLGILVEDHESEEAALVERLGRRGFRSDCCGG